jgi:hypothetical protein
MAADRVFFPEKQGPNVFVMTSLDPNVADEKHRDCVQDRIIKLYHRHHRSNHPTTR